MRDTLQWLYERIFPSKPSNDPTSPETEVVFEVLCKLREAAEANIGLSMKYVGLSLPVFFTDSQAGQILLAAEKVNVTVRYVTVNALAASAAHGIGVFEHYTDSSYCQAEIERFPRDIVLSLEYCGSGMTGALELENALPMDLRSTVDSYFVDDDLGANISQTTMPCIGITSQNAFPHLHGRVQGRLLDWF